MPSFARGYVKLIATLISFLFITANAEIVKKTNIAVISLTNLNVSEDAAKSLTVRLITEIQNLNTFEVLEREQMRGILNEQGFQQSEACDEVSCLVRIGKLLLVEKIIGGTISKIGETFSVQARIIDLQSGNVEKAVSRDYKGGIDVLMTIGMREVAEELCGKLAQQGAVKIVIPPEQRYKMERKSPVLGGVMSAFCPGLGQAYAKQYPWAAAFFSCFVLSIIAIETGPHDSTGVPKGVGTLGSFLFLISWIGSAIDAPFAVNQYNVQLKEQYGISLQINSYSREIGLSCNLIF